MVVTIIGIEEVDYVSKRTNKPVEGRKIYYTYPFAPTKDAAGLIAESCFCNYELAGELKVGDNIELFYNRFGSVADIRIIE